MKTKIKYAVERNEAVFDTECFKNYWAIAFKCINTGRVRRFELTQNIELDRAGISKILRNFRVYSFNGIKYDMVVIMAALSGWSNAELKLLSDTIIQENLQDWQAYQRFNIDKPPKFVDHIDVMSVSPGSPQMPSLKMYGGRLHSRRMQEMPVDIDLPITKATLPIVRDYHINDLDTTIDMVRDLKTQINLRAMMSDEYGVDVRSKSDAQIAEAVIKVEIERITGEKVERPKIRPGKFKYKAPAFIKFETPILQELLRTVTESYFTIGHDGKVYEPQSFESIEIRIGEQRYTFGLGGLHSTEKKTAHVCDGTFTLRDRDVTSYYPRTIQLTGLTPAQLGEEFQKIFAKIIDRRIAAKRAGDKNTAETLKIVLNGTFGKLGSPFSILYAPHLLIQTTVTGQLAILMLIERLELANISVVSANTDGIVSKVPNTPGHNFNFHEIINQWELDTGYETEESLYEALYSRDVNNYIAVYRDKENKLKVKLKGAYGERGPGLPGAAGQKHNPDAEICSMAVVQYLLHGIPVETTIEECEDIRKFVIVRRVKGGAEKNGEYIGKAVRWYQARDIEGCLTYATNGNRVASSEGAKPIMLLPDSLPDDVDYDWYVREAYAILSDIGVGASDPDLIGRTGFMLARPPSQKTIHRVRLPDGVAVCGKELDSIRDKWVEYNVMPQGMRLCSKCAKHV
jgi:hypothetical protein